jgi:hypothetical protein
MKISFAFFPIFFHLKVASLIGRVGQAPPTSGADPFIRPKHFSLYGRREREVRTTQKNEKI